jgi:hypothetical protein
MIFGALNQDINLLSRIFVGHCRQGFNIHTTSTLNSAKEKESKENKRKD